MYLASPQIVECPFCGAEKELLRLMSGNTCGARLWSDNKREAPMLPQVSFVQKCPNCSKYYMMSRQKDRYAAGGCSSELGTLTYPEMKEAFIQLSNEGFENIDEEREVRVLLLRSYNDCFYRNETDSQPSEDEVELNQKNLLWLIENWAGDNIMKAELYREAGFMDKAIEILANAKVDNDFVLKIKNEIERLAKANDPSVFEITNL